MFSTSHTITPLCRESNKRRKGVTSFGGLAYGRRYTRYTSKLAKGHVRFRMNEQVLDRFAVCGLESKTHVAYDITPDRI